MYWNLRKQTNYFVLQFQIAHSLFEFEFVPDGHSIQRPKRSSYSTENDLNVFLQTTWSIELLM